jgi:hypothetical protein
MQAQASAIKAKNISLPNLSKPQNHWANPQKQTSKTRQKTCGFRAPNQAFPTTQNH